MIKHPNQRELSAYVDGEARRPQNIARHLQQCPSCAKTHMALQKLSGHLRGLTPPAANIGFAERVVREICARDAKKRPASQPSWQRWGMPLASAAALLIVGLLTLQPVSPTVEQPIPVQMASSTEVMEAVIVEGMLETPGADTTDASWLFAAAERRAPEPAHETFIQLASMEWEAADRWDGSSDMGWAFGSVAHNETEAMLTVLNQYARSER